MLLVTFLWGVTFPLLKIGNRYLPPLSFGAWRFFLGAICLYFWVLRRRGEVWHKRRDFGPLMLLGLLQTTIMGGALHFGSSLVKSGLTPVVLYSYPFFYTFMAFILLKENLSWKQITGMLLGFVGLVLAVDPWRAYLTGPEIAGLIILLCGAVSWGLASVYLKARFKEHDKLAVTTYQMLYGSVVLFLVAALIEGGVHFSWEPVALGIISYTNLFTSALGFAILLTVQTRYPAGSTSVYLFLVPVFGVTFSSLILGEKLTLNLLLGLALVALGIVIVNRMATQGRPNYKARITVNAGR